MRTARLILTIWVSVIVALLIVEILELTHLFTVPIGSAVGNPIAFLFAITFTTVIALIGAIFIGIYISQRLQSPGAFTPFEEEMLKMRADVTKIRRDLDELRGVKPEEPPASDPPEVRNAP